ncbi:hypothetical protein HanRHA438_Chr10g0463081 [Helianthus annuus]|nr:hypothetical protein HanRHA438_Chr10g0463081 [Helianthus annuus]
MITVKYLFPSIDPPNLKLYNPSYHRPFDILNNFHSHHTCNGLGFSSSVNLKDQMRLELPYHFLH